MKAIVCVKQVPDTQGKVAVKADGTMDRAAMATITNPDDLNAVEAALQLNHAPRGAGDAVPMGPPPPPGRRRPRRRPPRRGGRQASDGDTAQVGPQIAEKLHLPQVTYVTEIKKNGNQLVVKRQLEDGYMEIAVQTPCLLTCIKELNTPRYMSVSGVFACYDKPIEVFDYNALKDDPLIETDTIGLKGSPTNVYKSFAPPVKGAGQMVESASQLVGILNDKHLI